MTNKVKPFFIRITDDMTPQMVQDAFDKCVDAGATFHSSKMRKIEGKNYPYRYSHCNYGVFGVDCENLVSIKESEHYFAGAQEITIDQLDEWLGLEAEQEWNGDGLPPVGVECEFKENSPSGVSVFSDWSKCSVLSYNRPRESSSELQIIIRDDRGDAAIIYSCDEPEFRKPETPEQKSERERLEAIETMCNEVNRLPHGEAFAAMSTLYDLGYRKQ